MRHIFEKIYAEGEWGYGSGPGSSPGSLKPYCHFLQEFIFEIKPNTIVDLGCGFFEPYASIAWGNSNYVGVDVVEDCIKSNIHHSTPNRTFLHADWSAMKQPPIGDLALCKDVLQHWCHADILDGLRILSYYKWVLITNSIVCGDRRVNSDIITGGFRPLNVLVKPYSLSAVICNSYVALENHELDVKETILWDPRISPPKFK